MNGSVALLLLTLFMLAMVFLFMFLILSEVPNTPLLHSALKLLWVVVMLVLALVIGVAVYELMTKKQLLTGGPAIKTVFT